MFRNVKSLFLAKIDKKYIQYQVEVSPIHSEKVQHRTCQVESLDKVKKSH